MGIILGAMRIPRPTRRWSQFSLCALLVFVTLLAIACGWLAVKLREMKREKAAATALEKLGADVAWNKSARGPKWLRGVLGEHFFTHVMNARLQGDPVTDSTLEPLDAMSHLEELWLIYTDVTDAGLAHLQGLRELKLLFISHAAATDAGLEKIAALKQLRTLWLREPQVTDAPWD